MGQIKSSGCFTQRGQILVCQLDFLVCFTSITKLDTTFSHPHPVETMTGPTLPIIRLPLGRCLDQSCLVVVRRSSVHSSWYSLTSTQLQDHLRLLQRLLAKIRYPYVTPVELFYVKNRVRNLPDSRDGEYSLIRGNLLYSFVRRVKYRPVLQHYYCMHSCWIA